MALLTEQDFRVESKVRQLSTAAAEALLKATTDAIIVVDSDGRIVFVNAQAERIFGYSSQELHLQSVETLLPDSTRARHRQHRQRFSGAPHSRPLMSGLSLRGMRKNGEIFDAEIALMPIEDGGDRLVASTIRDVSGDNSSELYFQHILEAAPDAIIIVDSDGRIAIANNEATVMFGYDRDQLIGQRIEMLLPAPLRDRHVNHRRGYLANPRLRPMGSGLNLQARRADGSEIPVEISLSPVNGSSGTFVASVIRNVTLRRKTESDLIEARQEAERAHKANTAFLAAASHDLRQPVQALTLLNGALRRTVKDPLAKEMVDSQQHSLDAMTNLLNSLLDISRLDAGAIKPVFEEFPVRRLVDRLSAEFARQARQKKLEFEASSNNSVVCSDINLLSEIIQNLVSNAIRYTENGRIDLSCASLDDSVSISVCDTGIGIAADQLDNIFREFHQLRGPGKNTEGFGLGLAIVRRLADLLDLEIKVTSEPGKGSCFSVGVPMAVGRESTSADRVSMAATAHPDGNSGLILLIEDDRSVAGAWAMLLKSHGYRVAIADSLASAKEVILGLDTTPVLVISDFHLLDGSTGVQAVQAVRSHFNENLPAFIVSGDTSKVVQEARSLKNSRVMSKPVAIDDLLRATRAAIASGNASPDQAGVIDF